MRATSVTPLHAFQGRQWSSGGRPRLGYCASVLWGMVFVGACVSHGGSCHAARRLLLLVRFAAVSARRDGALKRSQRFELRGCTPCRVCVMPQVRYVAGACIICWGTRPLVVRASLAFYRSCPMRAPGGASFVWCVMRCLSFGGPSRFRSPKTPLRITCRSTRVSPLLGCTSVRTRFDGHMY